VSNFKTKTKTLDTLSTSTLRTTTLRLLGGVQVPLADRVPSEKDKQGAFWRCVLEHALAAAGVGNLSAHIDLPSTSAGASTSAPSLEARLAAVEKDSEDIKKKLLEIQTTSITHFEVISERLNALSSPRDASSRKRPASPTDGNSEKRRVISILDDNGEMDSETRQAISVYGAFVERDDLLALRCGRFVPLAVFAGRMRLPHQPIAPTHLLRAVEVLRASATGLPFAFALAKYCRKLSSLLTSETPVDVILLYDEQVRRTVEAILASGLPVDWSSTDYYREACEDAQGMLLGFNLAGGRKHGPSDHAPSASARDRDRDSMVESRRALGLCRTFKFRHDCPDYSSCKYLHECSSCGTRRRHQKPCNDQGPKQARQAAAGSGGQTSAPVGDSAART
jgi:hypothetical protein